MDEYEFAVHETRTYDIITDVKDFKSEIGILYLNDFNHKVLEKLFHEFSLEFHSILECSIYVYMWKGHPLADRDLITLEDLREYPCLSFEQGTYNSFYFAEEVLSTYEYKRLIKQRPRHPPEPDGRPQRLHPLLRNHLRRTKRLRLLRREARLRRGHDHRLPCKKRHHDQ